MRMYDLVRALSARAGGGQIVDRPAEDDRWLFLGTFREDYEKYYTRLRRSLRGPHGPVRLLITTADVMTELMFQKKMEFADFGYLRRVYVDDVGAQVQLLPDNAPIEAAKEKIRNPSAAELLLGTLHQLPGPHIRSVLQLGLVSADVDRHLKQHIQSLCMKPTAQTVIMSPVRIPSTVHCLFSFYLVGQDRWEYLSKLIWNARGTIPGRAILFVRHDEDVLHIRRKLRGLGMNAKLFSEVYGDGAFRDKWRFLILKESEAFGIDIPLVSHVFITFAPSSWQTYLHMCGRTGRLGNVGWVYTVADKREARPVRLVAEDLNVNFVRHVVNQDLTSYSEVDIDRQTRDPQLYGLDPQYAVEQHYEVQTENPDFAYRPREFFSKPNVNKDFLMEDYTPVNQKQRMFNSATTLAKDVEKNPALVLELHKQGYLNNNMRPTKKLKRDLNHKISKHANSPLDPPKRR
ncbi:Helicase conserved C-terminal domain containing protein, putative [Angomonas deanei]|uniref:Helicase conserved C-terminal domain containing protein, putative n=1 Tax=Angomonas deanei TaxID=59799 RepID=A0A7G2C5K6_9TRYP|nr:Helicase conserved C-terminal domain containing protein, putative [Angomonas deanei]